MSLMEEYERIDFNKDDELRNYEILRKKQSKDNWQHPFVPNNCKEEKTWVHLCWIYMWFGTLHQQGGGEKLFRTNQLLQVISKLKSKVKQLPDSNILYLILYNCCRDGYFKMTKRVQEKMQALQILSSNQINVKFFEHQMKDFREKREKEKKDRATLSGSSSAGSISRSSQRNDEREEEKSAMA